MDSNDDSKTVQQSSAASSSNVNNVAGKIGIKNALQNKLKVGQVKLIKIVPKTSIQELNSNLPNTDLKGKSVILKNNGSNFSIVTPKGFIPLNEVKVVEKTPEGCKLLGNSQLKSPVKLKIRNIKAPFKFNKLLKTYTRKVGNTTRKTVYFMNTACQTDETRIGDSCNKNEKCCQTDAVEPAANPYFTNTTINDDWKLIINGGYDYLNTVPTYFGDQTDNSLFNDNAPTYSNWVFDGCNVNSSSTLTNMNSYKMIMYRYYVNCDVHDDDGYL